MNFIRGIMDNTFWHKQARDKPLFENLLWSRPQNRRTAGKLLIVGGNLHGFSAPVKAHAQAVKAGAGTARVVLPDALAKTVGPHFTEAEFTASTPVGSFSKKSLEDLLEGGLWADGVLLAGDFGRNSETAILLENFLDKHKGLLTVTGDTADYFLRDPKVLLERPDTTLTVEFSQLQKLAAGKVLFKHSMDLNQFCLALNELSKNFAATIVSYHAGQIAAAANGQISTTPAKDADLLSVAAYASVWQLQQPANIFEALTTAVYCHLNQ